ACSSGFAWQKSGDHPCGCNGPASVGGFSLPVHSGGAQSAVVQSAAVQGFASAAATAPCFKEDCCCCVESMEIEAVDGNLDNGKWNTTREKYRENRRPNGPFTEPGTVTIEGKVLKVNGALRSAVPFVVKIKFKYKGSGSDVKHCKVQWNEKWAEDFQVWDKRANKMRTVMRKGEWGNIFEILPKHMPDVSGDPLTQDYAWVEYKKKQPGLRCPGEYEFESFDAPFKIMDPKTM